MNNRQIRLLGLAVLTVVLVCILYNSSSVDLAEANKEVTAILGSNNDDKVDAEINKQISNMNSKPPPAEQESVEPDVAEDVVADYDPAKELLQIRSVSPMVLFSKTYCPYSKRLKQLLQEHYQITPQFAVVELDKHKHGAKLQAYLAEVSGRSTVPNVLIGASVKSKGGHDEFLNLHESNKLAGLLNEWGDKKIAAKKIETPSNL